VAEILEGAYPERLTELAPQLARHFHEAGDDERAVKYFTLAGDAAARVYAKAEALLHYTQAIELAQRYEIEAGQLAHLYIGRGRALEWQGRYPEALDNYRHLEILAEERGAPSLKLTSLMSRATIRSTPTPVYDATRGEALSTEALTLARELNDRKAEARILWNLMLLHSFTGQGHQAVAYGEQSLAIARELGLQEQLAYTLNDIFRCLMSTSQIERALAVVTEARELWRAVGNQLMLADNLSRSGRIFLTLGDYPGVITASDEARHISETAGNVWGQSFCRMYVGYVYLEQGEPAKTIELMEACVRLSEQAGFVSPQVCTRSDLAWIYGTLGAVEQGLELSRLAQTIAEQRLKSFLPWALACRARVLIMHGDLAEAQSVLTQGQVRLDPDDFASHAPIEMPLAEAELALSQHDFARVINVMDKLIARLRQIGVQLFLVDALCLKGQALLAENRLNEAEETLRAGRVTAEALGSRRSLWPILATLSQVQMRRGAEAEAQALRREARVGIDYIAARCPPDLRESFRNLPEVKRVTDSH
jgi:tetratricopeptide (TPR) repeat protein